MNRQITLGALAATVCLVLPAGESQAGHRHRSRSNSSHGCRHVQHQPAQNAYCGTTASDSDLVSTMSSSDCCGPSAQGYSGTYNGQAMGGQEMMHSDGSMRQGVSSIQGRSKQGIQSYGAPNYSTQQPGVYNSSANQNSGTDSNGQRVGVNSQGSTNSQGINVGLNTNNGDAQFQGRTNANANTNARNDGAGAGVNASGNNNAAGSSTIGKSGVRANVEPIGAAVDNRSNINAGGAVDSTAGSINTNAAGTVAVDTATDL